MNDHDRDGTSWHDNLSMEYHMKQYAEVKESTKAFSKYFSRDLNISKSILDIGTGAGAATFYLANEFSETDFIGIDQSGELISKAKEILSNFNLKNLSFDTGDWFDLDEKWKGVDGVISMQTLSWLSEIEQPMVQIFSTIKPNWIGLSSLFYEGDISCRIEVFEHSRDRKTFYNVYSIKELNRLASQYGYQVQMADTFDIDIDISRPANIDLMSTYTEKIQGNLDHQRLQISGPLLLNWYFVLISKIR